VTREKLLNWSAEIITFFFLKNNKLIKGPPRYRKRTNEKQIKSKDKLNRENKPAKTQKSTKIYENM